MLTLLDVNRAIDRLGGAAFAPRTRRGRFTDVLPPSAEVTLETTDFPVRELPPRRALAHTGRRMP